MNNKNIWIINETIGSKIHGMVFRPYYLAKEFVKNGNKVTIFSGSYTHIYSNPPEVKGFSKTEVIDSITYCWIKTPKYKKSQSFGRIVNAFVFVLGLFLVKKKSFGKPDVIIVTSPTPFSIINGYYYKKKFNAKLIFEVRDIWPLTLIEIGSISKWHPFILFMQMFENFSYRVSDHVVSVLPEAYKHMEQHGMKRNKFVYIPNGIDESEKLENSQSAQKLLNLIPQNKLIVMYAGKIGISNALENIVNAAKLVVRNDNIHFVIIGSGPEKQNLSELVRENDLKNVAFLNPVAKSEMQLILSRADVCYIGLPKLAIFKFGVSANKLFDYMYAGKPIIYSIEEENNPVKLADCGISVNADNPDDIVTAILKLDNMGEKGRAEMGLKGKAYVIKYHTYKKLAERYLNIFV
ncbi:MAG TPA: glycosyltransferase family 4 protein [bacterium]|nr:glycosyltransferase family 4 protein [bacterium]HPS28791.1 glycosyltransferase family 4 protein [bacterium]